MQVKKVKKGDPVAKRQDKVMEWYLIQAGSVTRHYNYAEITMGANSIIGILENTWFSCDYTASEDTTLIVIPCKNADDLHKLLEAQANFRAIFLRTALEQRHQAICLYASLKQKATLLHATAQNSYSEYKALCAQFMMPEHSFYRISHFEALTMQHRVEKWELKNSQSLMKGFLRDYLQLMIRNNDLCVGAIMEASAQMHRTAQGIEEIANYLMCNRDVLWNDTEDDIFRLYFHLAVRLASNGKDPDECRAHMEGLCQTMKALDIYDPMQLDECAKACKNHQLSAAGDAQSNIADEDCVAHIMSYAGYGKEEIRQFKLTLQSYKELPDRASGDKDARALRKTISARFYEIYKKAFFNSMRQAIPPSPILLMFFNFGFMDVDLLGVEQTNALVRFSESLGLFNYTHIYTIYEWLKSIYSGKKEPSRNEFDLYYNGYLQEQLKQGEITQSELARLRDDPCAKVTFEIDNLFQSTHKTVSGRLLAFCPILSSDDLFGPFEKIASTAARIEQSINNIRNIDYSVLYREVLFSDPERGINQEDLMKEIMPDVILLPCIGSRSVMWQETSGVRTDTSARFLFPIFMSADLDEQMLLTMGRYRWEICRHVQGSYWNDFRVKSLTAEYYDYLQFYRKNKDLSADAKEKLKSALQHARNNFREVFVMDYVNWIKYESQGSFRLHKLTRDILTRYCPFSREIRDSLSGNPLYQNAFSKLEIENQKNIKRLQAVYNKYQAAGGEITADLTENLRYYQL
ncbi:cyclic nucleotide-binding domain-containing protein [Lachnospiraceae bacterium 47-T17]